MKVLFVTNLWPDEQRPWHGTFVKTQADSLQGLGVDLDVLAIRGYADRGAYAVGARRAAALNVRCPYDVIHAHYGHSGVIGRLALRAPLVISFTGSDLNGKPLPDGTMSMQARIEAWTFRRLPRLASATITKSAEMEELLPPSLRARNHVIPNGVDLERFRRIPQEEARRRLGWEPGEKAVLFVGDPSRPWKGHGLADAAATELGRRLPEARLRVAHGVDPGEMPVWMSAADALILPSLAEGSPNVVKEALAAELPVVSTPVGDVPERLAGLPAGFIRPPEAAAMAEALEQAVRHGPSPEARAAVQDLSLERVAERVLSVYRSVARDGTA